MKGADHGEVLRAHDRLVHVVDKTGRDHVAVLVLVVICVRMPGVQMHDFGCWRRSVCDVTHYACCPESLLWQDVCGLTLVYNNNVS